MTVTVYSYPNNHLRLEVLGDAKEASVGKKSELSLEEFNAAIQRISELSIKFDDPDAEPLSDYAMSRESIYEGHPKL